MRYNLEGQEISKEEEKGDGGKKGKIGVPFANDPILSLSLLSFLLFSKGVY